MRADCSLDRSFDLICNCRCNLRCSLRCSLLQGAGAQQLLSPIHSFLTGLFLFFCSETALVGAWWWIHRLHRLGGCLCLVVLPGLGWWRVLL